jgi:prepilin-type N-terminal cleavage/methylation domain-containing protein
MVRKDRSQPEVRNGYTLVELIVAITLGLFVATLIFAGYTDLFKGFRLQARRAENVRDMIHIQREIDGALKTAEVLTLVSTRKIVFLDRQSRKEHTIEFHDSTVFRDAAAVQKHVRDFVFTASEKKSEQGFRIVKWEALLAHNAWAGGVAVIKESKGAGK